MITDTQALTLGVLGYEGEIARVSFTMKAGQIVISDVDGERLVRAALALIDDGYRADVFQGSAIALSPKNSPA